MKSSPPFPVRDVVLVPGRPSPDFSPRLQDKIREWPGDETTLALYLGRNTCRQDFDRFTLYFNKRKCVYAINYIQETAAGELRTYFIADTTCSRL